MEKKENIILTKTIAFSLSIIEFREELEETKYWLMLCKHAKTYPFDKELEVQIKEIGLIIYKILSSSKKKQLLH